MKQGALLPRKLVTSWCKRHATRASRVSRFPAPSLQMESCPGFRMDCSCECDMKFDQPNFWLMVQGHTHVPAAVPGVYYNNGTWITNLLAPKGKEFHAEAF